MKELTIKQKAILEYIIQFVKDKSYAPSYEDIARFFKFSSVASVRTHLELLEKKGVIKREGRARGIQILKNPIKEQIPILGAIAAGNLNFSLEEDLGTIMEIPGLKYQEGRFALKVKGLSMKNAGILDGDYAIIEKNLKVNNGDIVAVLVGEEATLKRIYFEKEKVILKPENSLFDDIILSENDFYEQVQLLGKFIALIRSTK
ncbi:MAG: transcriptional repressor LexA [Candidatus Margulisiibacteriota bacterium]